MTAPRRVGLLEPELTKSVIGAFFDVYGELGFGYREFIYALALDRVLIAKGHRVAREVPAMVYFRGEPLARQRVDMVVDDKLIVENKSTERLNPNALPQLFGYLCATDYELGLLLHYGREPTFYRSVCENRYKRRS